MPLKLGTNAIALPLSKALLGTNLVYQKEAGWVLKTGNFIPTFSSGEVSKDNFNITYDGFTASVDNDVYKMFDNDDETEFLIQYNKNIGKSSTCNVIMEFAKTIKPTKINFNYLSTFSNLSISLSADNVNFDTVYSLNNDEKTAEENVTIELDNLIEYKYLKMSTTSGASNVSSNVLEIYTLQVVEWYEEE